MMQQVSRINKPEDLFKYIENDPSLKTEFKQFFESNQNFSGSAQITKLQEFVKKKFNLIENSDLSSSPPPNVVFFPNVLKTTFVKNFYSMLANLNNDKHEIHFASFHCEDLNTQEKDEEKKAAENLNENQILLLQNVNDLNRPFCKKLKDLGFIFYSSGTPTSVIAAKEDLDIVNHSLSTKSEKTDVSDSPFQIACIALKLKDVTLPILFSSVKFGLNSAIYHAKSKKTDFSIISGHFGDSSTSTKNLHILKRNGYDVHEPDQPTYDVSENQKIKADYLFTSKKSWIQKIVHFVSSFFVKTQTIRIDSPKVLEGFEESSHKPLGSMIHIRENPAKIKEIWKKFTKKIGNSFSGLLVR